MTEVDGIILLEILEILLQSKEIDKEGKGHEASLCDFKMETESILVS